MTTNLSDEASTDQPEAPPACVEPPAATALRRPLMIAGLAMIAALTTWGLASAGDPDPPESGQLLVVDTDGDVSLIDTTTGAAVYEVAGAVVAPDRRALFTTRPGAVGTTRLESRSPADGEVTGSTTLSGTLEVRAVSPAGGAVVLGPERDSRPLYAPEPRTSTELTVAYLDDRPAAEFTLDGNYEPETFSLDERTLYLLEFQPPLDPTHYLVRELDLATGLIAPVKTTQVDLQPEMRGVARAQAMHPSGRYLYTLYSIPNGGDPVHDPADTSDTRRWAFVHVLDLELGLDVCIFLPVPFGTTNDAHIGLGLSPDGDDLYVVDPTSQEIAHIDTETMTVASVASLDDVSLTRTRSEIAVSDDGSLYLASTARLYEVDLSSWTVTDAWWSDHPTRITGLSLSADGRELRVARAGAIHVIDRATSTEIGVFEAPDGDQLSILGPPAGTMVQIPLECAC